MSCGDQNVRDEIVYDRIVFDIDRLVKVYPGQAHPANLNITLQIYRGEIFGLLGDNGAGKTTLVRQMANLARSTSGRITFLGQEIGKDPLHVARHVGYMPQGGQTLNHLTVGEALYFTAHLRGLDHDQAHRNCEALLDLLQIKDLRRQPNARLSGGQKRLLQLAVALAGNPPVLILDEPTNDLDPVRRKLVWQALRRLNQEQEKTIIFITHDAVEAEKIIQRVGIIRSGELIALGKPSELKAAVDRKLRLELFFSPDEPPRLPPGFQLHPLAAGRWLVYLDRDEADQAITALDMDRIEDFRLYSATLEDLYLFYANQHETTNAPGATN